MVIDYSRRFVHRLLQQYTSCTTVCVLKFTKSIFQFQIYIPFFKGIQITKFIKTLKCVMNNIGNAIKLEVNVIERSIRLSEKYALFSDRKVFVVFFLHLFMSSRRLSILQSIKKQILSLFIYQSSLLRLSDIKLTNSNSYNQVHSYESKIGD